MANQAAGSSASNPRDTPQDNSITVPVLNGAAPQTVVCQLSDARRFIRGITIYNQSSLSIGLYFNRVAVGTPDVIVVAAVAQGIPLSSLKSVSIGFMQSAGLVPSGQVYIHYTTDLVVSTSSAISVAVTPTGPQAIWDTANWDAASWQT